MSGHFLSRQADIAASSPSLGLSIVRPKKKLKALHWEKVDDALTTHWAAHAPSAEAREEKYLELRRKGILDEVEKLFMAKETKAIGQGAGKKNDKKQIISNDLRKAYAIALAKFSQYSVEKVVQMIIHCDTEVLDNPVVLEFLQKEDLCTIPDNVSKSMAPYSKDWTGPDADKVEREQDPNELTREDQIFLYTAFELHHYWRARMRALALTRSFESDYDEMTEKMRQIVSVSESLRDSVSLMNVLGLILDIGNYMNDPNKQARGFKLSSLARLGMVKDDKNQSSLADLVERIVRNQYPEWEGFTEDIAGVTTAQKINVDQLEADARKYIENIRNVQMSLDSGNLSDPKKFHPQDRVLQVVARCMKEARRKAEQMQVYLEEMLRTYKDIMVFYGEDPTDENARREFFAKLAQFIAEWKKSRQKNMEWEEQRRKNEAALKRKNALLAAQAQEAGSTSSTNTGAMDSLLEKLRAAAPQARDQRDRRRRARLKDRHQQRVASGQKMPELAILSGMNADGTPNGSGASQNPDASSDQLADQNGATSADPNTSSSNLLSVPNAGNPSPAGDLGANADGTATNTITANGITITTTPATTAEDDVAQRAALLLQGMRNDSAGANGESAGLSGADGDLSSSKRDFSVRRSRRQTADEERRMRRRRRELAQSTASNSAARSTDSVISAAAAGSEVGEGQGEEKVAGVDGATSDRPGDEGSPEEPVEGVVTEVNGSG